MYTLSILQGKYWCISGLINGMFAKLHLDSLELITSVLETLEKRVLSNSSVTKTQRVKIFNETTVPQIIQCFDWSKHSKRELDKVKYINKQCSLVSTELFYVCVRVVQLLCYACIYRSQKLRQRYRDLSAHSLAFFSLIIKRELCSETPNLDTATSTVHLQNASFID